MHDYKAGQEENGKTNGDEDDAADVCQFAALENGATVEQLDDDNVEGDYAAAEGRDVGLEERVGLLEGGVIVDPV